MIAPHLDRRRFAVLASVALLTNLFVAPASLFQNGYLKDVRGFSATTIAIFTMATATPAGLGLILGGRFADVGGRKRLIAVALAAGDGAHRAVLQRRRAGDVAVGVPRRDARRARPTRRWPSTAPSCSRPATAVGPPG